MYDTTFYEAIKVYLVRCHLSSPWLFPHVVCFFSSLVCFAVIFFVLTSYISFEKSTKAKWQLAKRPNLWKWAMKIDEGTWTQMKHKKFPGFFLPFFPLVFRYLHSINRTTYFFSLYFVILVSEFTTFDFERTDSTAQIFYPLHCTMLIKYNVTQTITTTVMALGRRSFFFTDILNRLTRHSIDVALYFK